MDMCPGEKRKLTIQPDWAYGERGVGPIPAKSVLSKSSLQLWCYVLTVTVFETELVSIEGVDKDEL